MICIGDKIVGYKEEVKKLLNDYSSERIMDIKSLFCDNNFITKFMKLVNEKCIYCERKIDIKDAKIILHKDVLDMPNSLPSWDNLLLICQDCNNLINDCDIIAKPLINPIIDDPRFHIAFYGSRIHPRDGSVVGINTYDTLFCTSKLKTKGKKLAKCWDNMSKIINDVISKLNIQVNEAYPPFCEIERETKKINEINILEKLRNTLNNRILDLLSKTFPENNISAITASLILEHNGFHELVDSLKKNGRIEFMSNHVAHAESIALKKSFFVDILVIVATKEEADAIYSIPLTWTEYKLVNGFSYHITNISNFIIAIIRGHEMREIPVALIGQYAISELNPKKIAMVGFCAGRQGKTVLGDIIVPKTVYKYGEGKQVSEDKLLHEMRAIQFNPAWIVDVENFGDEWRKKYNLIAPETIESQLRTFINRLHDHSYKSIQPKELDPDAKLFPNLKMIIKNEENEGNIFYREGIIKTTKKGISNYKNTIGLAAYEIYKKPCTKTGILATGHNVQEWSGIFNELDEYDRRTNALDMEAYTIAMLSEYNDRIPYIIAKGVGDYAKDGKEIDNDAFIPYACQSAFYFVIEFFKNH